MILWRSLVRHILRHPGVAGVAAFALSCIGDTAGPNVGRPGVLQLVPQFQSSAPAGIVTIDHIRIVLFRPGGTTPVIDTVVQVAPGDTVVNLRLTVPVFTQADTFTARLALITPQGDTAFRGGPLTVVGKPPAAPGATPPPVSVPIVYTGTGASADKVVITVKPPLVLTGDTVVFQAVASQNGVPIPGTPIAWVSLDLARATVPNPALGRVVGGSQRGAARIVAQLLTGPADTGSVAVSLLPAAIGADSGSGQSGVVHALLAKAIVARVKASDSLGVTGVWVKFAVLSGGGALSADSALTDSAGRARVNWTLGPTAGAQQIKATTARLPNALATFTATGLAGAPASIVANTGNNQTATVGTAVTTPPSVKVKDADGNPVPGVTVTFAVTSGGGAVSGATPLTGDGGIAQAGGWTLGTVAGVNQLTASVSTVVAAPRASGGDGAPAATANGPAPAATLSVTFAAKAIPGAATSLVLTGIPATPTAGATADATVTARDTYGNTATGYRGTVHFTSSDPIAVLPADYAFLDGDVGVHTFAGGVALKTAGTRTVTVTDAGAPGVTGSATATVAVGPVSAAVSTISVSSPTVASGGSVTLTLQAKDAYGNNRTTGGLTVVFTATGGTSTGTIGATTDNGNGTYTASFTGVTAGTATTIGATINATPVSSSLPTVTVSGGAPSTATSTVALSAPTVPSGASVTATLQTKDAQGNLLTAGGLTVTFAASGGTSTVTIGTTTDNGNGTYSAAVTGVLAGTATTIAATISGNPVANTAALSVTPGAASVATSAVTLSAATVVSGSTVTATLSTKDAAGNALTTGGLTVVFTASGGGSTVTIGATTDNGNGSYTAVLTGVLAGSATTIGAKIGGTAVTSTLPTLTVSPGPLSLATSKVTLSAGTVVSGSTVTATLQAKDAAGNNLTTTGLTVVFTASGGASTVTIGSTTDNANGTYVAALTGVLAGSATTIGATIGGTPVGSALPALTVTPGAATALFFTVQPSDATAGASLAPAVQVTARDAAGNVATGFSSNVEIAIGTNPSAGTLGGTATVTAAAGVATFSNLSINKVGTGYTLKASASGLANVFSSGFAIGPAAATSLVVTGLPGGFTAGTSQTVTVTALDPFGNTATGYTGTVHFTSNDAQAVLPSNYAFLGGDNGVHGFAGVILKTAGTRSVTATDVSNGSITGAQSASVTPDIPAALAYIQQPTSATAGVAIAPAIVVAVEDQFGNVVDTATDAISVGFLSIVECISSCPPPVYGTKTKAAVSGIATFNDISLQQAANGYSFLATATGFSPVSSATFNITPDVPAGVSLVSGDQQIAVINTALTDSLKVKITDQYGNGVNGVTVNWTLDSASSGTVSPASVATDPGGLAATKWTFGSAVGTFTAVGAFAGASGFIPVFTAVAAPVGTTVTWSGGLSSDWSTGGNWSTGSPPGTTDKVFIPAGMAYEPGLTSGPITITDLVIAGDVGVGAFTLNVTGNLSTVNAGTLTMTNASGIVTIAGNASFGGGSTNTKLTGGILNVAGNFTQTNSSTASFAASGTHKVVLNGSALQTISFASPGSGASNSHFQDLDIENLVSGVGVTFANSAQVNGSVTLGSIGNTTNSTAGTVTIGAGLNNFGGEGGAWNVLNTTFTGSPPLLPSTITGNVTFTGNATAPSMTVTGNVTVTGSGANLTIGDFGIVTVNGNFATASSGTLTMTALIAPPSLTVTGNATFGGGSTSSKLTSGTLSVGGNFSQSGDPASFAPSGTHKVVLNGTSTTTPQSVALASASSFFNDLDITTASAGVTMSGTVRVTGALYVNSGPLSGAGTVVVDGTFNTASGSSVTIATARIGGSLGVSVPSDFAANVTEFFGSSQAIPGAAYHHVLITGPNARLNSNDMVFGGNLTIDGGGLDMNDATGFTNPSAGLIVNGNLVTQNSGTLRMINGEKLEVFGNATFAGGNVTDSLTSGTLLLHGNFAQTTNAVAFAVNPGFTVAFVGSSSVTPQTVTFANSGFAASHFGDVLDSTGTAGISLGSNVFVAQNFATGTNSVTRPVLGNGHTLTTRSLSVSNATFDNAPLIVEYSASLSGTLAIGTTTFQSYSASADQLTIYRPGDPVASTFTGLTFTTTPTSGVGSYIRAVDTANNLYPFTIIMVSPSPSPPGSGTLKMESGSGVSEVALISWP